MKSSQDKYSSLALRMAVWYYVTKTIRLTKDICLYAAFHFFHNIQTCRMRGKLFLCELNSVVYKYWRQVNHRFATEAHSLEQIPKMESTKEKNTYT